MSCPSCIIALSGVDGFSASEIPTDPKCIAIALLAMVAGGYAGHKLVKGSPKAGMVGGGAAGFVLGALLGGCKLKDLSIPGIDMQPTPASTGPLVSTTPPIGRPGTPAPGGRPGTLTVSSSSSASSISTSAMLPQGQSTQQGGVFAKLAQAFNPIVGADFQSQCPDACSQKYAQNSDEWNSCAEVCRGATAPSSVPSSPIRRTKAAAQSGLSRLGMAIQNALTLPSAKSQAVVLPSSPRASGGGQPVPPSDVTAISAASRSTVSSSNSMTAPSSGGSFRLSASNVGGAAAQANVAQQAAAQQSISIFR